MGYSTRLIDLGSHFKWKCQVSIHSMPRGDPRVDAASQCLLSMPGVDAVIARLAWPVLLTYGMGFGLLGLDPGSRKHYNSIFSSNKISSLVGGTRMGDIDHCL
uniref:Uncharacterized protein n=1 Tax=Picea glauca TaxID=3330 RepID=A0A101M2C7_PICGL|nr:hypothetical protein ABT39_MTgene2830 [Picea glauca]QHR87637.1 hypothetical protein Q903MT_gene1649 [Picea sitchensis]